MLRTVLVSCSLVALLGLSTHDLRAQGAQEAPKAPALSMAEQADFSAARALETAARAASQETPEYRRLLKAQETLKARQEAYQTRLTGSAGWKAYAAHRIRLDNELRARGLQLDWQTGEVTPIPTSGAPRP